MPAPADDQTTALQLAALKRARCPTSTKTKVYQAHTPSALPCSVVSGALRAGDTVIVWKLDRLGRSLRDLITMLDDLRARGVKFHSLTEAIDAAKRPV